MCQIVSLSYVRGLRVQVNKKTFWKSLFKAIIEFGFLAYRYTHFVVEVEIGGTRHCEHVCAHKVREFTAIYLRPLEDTQICIPVHSTGFMSSLPHPMSTPAIIVISNSKYFPMNIVLQVTQLIPQTTSMRWPNKNPADTCPYFNLFA